MLLHFFFIMYNTSYSLMADLCRNCRESIVLHYENSGPWHPPHGWVWPGTGAEYQTFLLPALQIDPSVTNFELKVDPQGGTQTPPRVCTKGRPQLLPTSHLHTVCLKVTLERCDVPVSPFIRQSGSSGWGGQNGSMAGEGGTPPKHPFC